MIRKNKYRYIFLSTFISCCLAFGGYVISGEATTGKVKYELDLSDSYTSYQLRNADKKWINALVKKFQYQGDVVVFLKTTLKLKRDGGLLDSQVYKTKNGKIFFINEGDAIVDFNQNLIHSPGTGGFSVHAKKVRNFIVCLNYNIGLDFERSSLPTQNDVIWWYSGDFKRLR